MASGYHLFTSEIWENWDDYGKDNVVEVFNKFLEDDQNDPGISKPSITKDLSRALYEVIWAIVKGDLSRENGRNLLIDVMNWHEDMASQVVEVASLVDLEISNIEKLSRQREHLIGLLRVLELERLYKERLDLDTLGDAGIVKNKKNFHTKQIKVRTKMFYKQQKFNLLREESEGYAKLVTELNQDFNHEVTPHSMIQVIRSLIGCFNLDPNRVLDLILEAFECRPEQNEFYTSLLHLFPCEVSTISELICFKLGNYFNDSAEAAGIYKIMALLVQGKILQITDLYNWLTPDDQTMIDEHQKEEADAREIVRRANVVSTKDKETGGQSDSKKDRDREREEEERDIRTSKRSLDSYGGNQKMRFIIALLEIGDWEHYVEISKKFPDFYLVSCPPISKTLCHLIHGLIEPMYRKNSGLPSRLKGNVVKVVENYLSPSPAQDFDELCDVVFPMISALGPHINNDLGLVFKILRIAKTALQEISNSGVRSVFYYSYLTILDDSILPALSMLHANPCVAEELWESLKFYPYQHRYKLYGRWKNESYNQHPSMMRERTALLKKAKYIMMRVTKETVKPVSRGIGKLSHNNPAPILEYILKQCQLYDNLIGPIVDSLKYLTSLSYDVLGYCIVETLSLKKDRTANDAMAISPWLQSLSNFCGTVFKKFNLELGGVLQFVANQLKSERSIDLLILREIVQKMGGIDSMEDLTLEQLDAMCGGDFLRREAGQYQQERNIKKSSMRLKDALIENNLAVPMLLLMAQQRSSCVYNQTESPHLKLVGKLYDQCQDTMVQFGSYLFQMMTIEEMNTKVPAIGKLLSEGHINADVAFFLVRPLYTYILNSKYDELRRKDRAERKQTSDQRKLLYIEACNEVFTPIVDSIRPHYSPKVWEDMDPSFFLTFWTLTMSDLEVPSHIYEKEIKKISDQSIQLSKLSKDEMTSNKRKKEQDRLASLKDKLQEEERRQKEHVERVYARLEQEKEKWFMMRAARSPKNDTVTAFLQLCLFPRCTFTALDAIYCAKFVKMLHILKTPNFSTLIFYDRMYCDITYTVASCTEQEAHRYSRFLLGTLDTVMQWHASRTNYEKECANYPGFVTKYRVSKLEANDYVDYENYRHVVHKWHYKITKAIVTCLESGDYIQIRNAIFILQGVITRFPAIANLSAVIEKRIEKVKNEEKTTRNDLYVLANSYSGRLKVKKPSLLPESEFHIVRKPEPKPAEVKTPSAPKVNKPVVITAPTSNLVTVKTVEVTNKSVSPAEEADKEPEANGEVIQKDTPKKSEVTSKPKVAEKRISEDSEIKEVEIKESTNKKLKREEADEKTKKKLKRTRGDDETDVVLEEDNEEGNDDEEEENSIASNTSNDTAAAAEAVEGSKRRKLDAGKTVKEECAANSELDTQLPPAMPVRKRRESKRNRAVSTDSVAEETTTVVHTRKIKPKLNGRAEENHKEKSKDVECIEVDEVNNEEGTECVVVDDKKEEKKRHSMRRKRKN